MEQLGLFDVETSHLATARRALGRFDLDRAEAALLAHIGIFTGDRSAQALCDLVRRLRARRDAAAGDCVELDALIEIRSDVPEDMLPAWHFRIAELAELDPGQAYVAGEPIGFHWLAAGQSARAIQASRVALAAATSDGRARAVLADALYMSGEGESARREYLRAFMDDPAAIPLDRLADPAVARLADLARHEYDLDEPVAGWIPAVGIVERIFPLPHPALPGLSPESPDPARPRAFVEFIARERAGRTLDERVDARRKMKALAPLLFDAYLRAYA
jgi:hypothetical protein